MTNRAEVLLDRLLLNRLPLRRQKSGTDALGKVLNVPEVRGDFQPAAEAPSLVPGGGVFLEYGGIEPLGDCLLCSMVVRC